MSLSPQIAAEKPTSVVFAVRLLYLMLVIGIMRTILKWGRVPVDPRIPPAVHLFLALLTLVFTFALMIWLIYKMDRGRNWARITFLVLFLLGVPLLILQLMHSLPYAFLSDPLDLVQTVLQAVALVLLFSSKANEWFRAVRMQILPALPT